MQRPGQEDLALVGEAVTALRRGLGPTLHPSASAARSADGVVVTALTLSGGAASGGICSEAAAVSAVLAQGRRVATIVTVKHVSDDATRVVAPCGACRSVLLAHAPAVRVVHLADGLRVARVAALPG